MSGVKAEVVKSTDHPVFNPANGQLIGGVKFSTEHDLNHAIGLAGRAFPGWSSQTLKERVQVFFRLRTLLEENLTELGTLVSSENGKTQEEGEAEVYKAMELCEFACSLPQMVADEIQEVSRGVECRTSHVPVGIVGCITPFNFPLMVPMWSLPNALALGNCVILKPSEQTPLSANRIVELFRRAGLPPSVLQVLHGDRELVEDMCDHAGIDNISFVGSTAVARSVYKRATANLKNCIALGGAKNHLIVLPDASETLAAANIAASMTGCAGQRCMAASAMVAVGQVDHIVEKIVEEAKAIRAGENLGAVISRAAKHRIEKYITEAEEQGAKILLDGRNTVVAGREEGYYVGPTVIDHVKPEMAIAKEEVFGPVLAIMRSDDIDEAIAIENASNYGNAASVFTQDGGMADYVMARVNAGMVGVNIGVPVPREPFSFGGWNESKFGVTDITGKSSIHFWTKLKKRTTKWDAAAWTNWMS